MFMNENAVWKVEKEMIEERDGYLHIALDEIEGGDSHVGESATHYAACCTCCVEGWRIHLYLLLGSFNWEADLVSITRWRRSNH